MNVQLTCKLGNTSGEKTRKRIFEACSIDIGRCFLVKYPLGWYEKDLGWNKTVDYIRHILAIGKIRKDCVMLMDDFNYEDDDGPLMPLLKLKSELWEICIPLCYCDV